MLVPVPVGTATLDEADILRPVDSLLRGGAICTAGTATAGADPDGGSEELPGRWGGLQTCAWLQAHQRGGAWARGWLPCELR